MNQAVIRQPQCYLWNRVICILYCLCVCVCVTVIQYITVSGGTCNMLYFGSSREIFALLKSPRMIKIESGCCCSVSVNISVSFCKAELTCACRGM